MDKMTTAVLFQKNRFQKRNITGNKYCLNMTIKSYIRSLKLTSNNGKHISDLSQNSRFVNQLR